MSQQPHDPQHEQQLLQHFRQHSQGEPSAALDALILDAARQAVAQEPAKPSRAQRLHAWLFGSGSRTRWSVAFAGLATLGLGLSLTWRTQEQASLGYDEPAPVVMQAPAPAAESAPVAAEARKQVAAPEQKKAEMAESMAGSIDPNASYGASAPGADLQRQMAPAKPQSAPPAEVLSDAAAEPASPSTAAKAEAYAAAKLKAQAVAKAQAQAAARAKMQSQDKAEGQQFLSEEAPPLEQRLHDVLRLREEGQTAQADQLLKTLRAEYPQRDLDAELKRLQSEVEKPASSP